LEGSLSLWWVVWGKNITSMLMWRNVVLTLPSVLFVNRWRIWYPKFAKNNVGAKNHEMKVWKHNIHQESYIWFYHTWRVESIQSKEEYLCIIHDKMDHSKTTLLKLVVKNKMVSSLGQLLVTLTSMIAYGHGNEALLNFLTSSS
jgi:hypothetical protein